MSIANSTQFDTVLADMDVASMVADPKACFFIGKESEGNVIDYRHAVSGGLRTVPEGAAKDALSRDYSAMIESDVLVEGNVAFDELMTKCEAIQDILHRAVNVSTLRSKRMTPRSFCLLLRTLPRQKA
jgi:hypothetical protein